MEIEGLVRLIETGSKSSLAALLLILLSIAIFAYTSFRKDGVRSRLFIFLLVFALSVGLVFTIGYLNRSSILGESAKQDSGPKDYENLTASANIIGALPTPFGPNANINQSTISSLTTAGLIRAGEIYATSLSAGGRAISDVSVARNKPHDTSIWRDSEISYYFQKATLIGGIVSSTCRFSFETDYSCSDVCPQLYRKYGEMFYLSGKVLTWGAPEVTFKDDKYGNEYKILDYAANSNGAVGFKLNRSEQVNPSTNAILSCHMRLSIFTKYKFN